MVDMVDVLEGVDMVDVADTFVTPSHVHFSPPGP